MPARERSDAARSSSPPASSAAAARATSGSAAAAAPGIVLEEEQGERLQHRGRVLALVVELGGQEGAPLERPAPVRLESLGRGHLRAPPGGGERPRQVALGGCGPR